MARTNGDDMLMEDDLAAAFLGGEEEVPAPADIEPVDEEMLVDDPEDATEDEWENTDEFPGQLAVDVYETADKLIVKARTAGISKSDLDVSISDNILRISGVLSAGEEEQTTRWHIQECYWGEFSRTIALPVQVREDENSVKAELKEGVLTISGTGEMFDYSKVSATLRKYLRIGRCWGHIFSQAPQTMQSLALPNFGCSSAYFSFISSPFRARLKSLK